MRVEHHCAAPDQGPVAPYVDELSTTHFWVVDGIWPDGTLLDARLQYYGNDADALDYELYGGTEANGFLAWRPNAGEPWQECPSYEWQPGSLSNGAGLFRVLDLKKGQYAFAKGDVSVGIEGALSDVEFALWPNPTADRITVQSEAPIQRLLVWNAAGQLVAAVRPPSGTTSWEFNAAEWGAGTYYVGVNDRAGEPIVVH